MSSAVAISACLRVRDYVQVPKGYPTRAGQSGGRVEEAHRAGDAVQPPGEDHRGCSGEPQDQRVHLLMAAYIS